MRVFVLLFNAGTDNEGIHTLKLKDGDRDVILMFESEDDAARYGLMLEAQDFLSPAVECLESEEIDEFCKDSAYESILVPEGTLALPPETNLQNTDWHLEGAKRPAMNDAAMNDAAPDFSDSELERFRQRLEGLL